MGVLASGINLAEPSEAGVVVADPEFGSLRSTQGEDCCDQDNHGQDNWADSPAVRILDEGGECSDHRD